MATNLKATFVGAALAASAAGVAVPAPARSEPTDSSADTSLYSYERGLEGNCIGWQRDSE